MEKGHIRLNSPRDCRKFLARCINETQHGKMKSDLLRVLTYSLKTLVGILSDSDLEERILLLEKTILNGKEQNNVRQIARKF